MPREAERLREQQLGVEARRVDALALEVLRAPRGEHLAQRHPRVLERAALLVGGERLGERVEVAREHVLEPVRSRRRGGR